MTIKDFIENIPPEVFSLLRVSSTDEESRDVLTGHLQLEEEDERNDRMNIISQNGNDGEHYSGMCS